MLFFKRIILIGAFLFTASSAFAQGFDHSALDRFLKQYVDSSGRINYAAAKQGRADLDQYLDQIKRADRGALKSGPKQEHLAFWLNVYHAGLLSLTLENYPLKSSQEIPSFWDRQFLEVGLVGPGDKMRYGLSQIRNEMLLSQFQDEKIHFALALGAKDGPLFPREAFTGPRVLGQLFKCARREVSRPEMVRVDSVKRVVSLSKLFEWYSPDLIKNFGRPERRGKFNRTDSAIINFLIRYSKKIEDIKFLKTAKYKIEYPFFDWSLNDSSTAG